MSRVFFVAGLAGLLIGGIDLYENMIFQFDGKDAMMELADSTKKPKLLSGGYDVHLLNVKYVSMARSLLNIIENAIPRFSRK